MSPEVEKQAFALFERLRGLPIDQRDSALWSDSAASDEVRSAVRALFAHDSPTNEFLGMPVECAAGELVQPLASGPYAEELEGYTVVRQLGRGGFGEVLLVRQHTPDRLVAIKLMHAGVRQDESRRLLFEAEALARLAHPNIAAVYHVGRTTEQVPRTFIVMEYVEGVTLDAFIREQNPDPDVVMTIMRAVCLAIEHAHQRGVLHRDLSPRNILVTPSGIPKVIDFGLATSLERRDSAVQRMTMPGSILGTLRYASPEQLSGEMRELDTRSDTYALGVIAYEALTRRHPFVDGTATIAEAVQCLASAQPARPSQVRASLTRELDAVLLKAIEREPARRYQTARAFADDFANILTDRPVEARRHSTLYIAMKFCRRHRRSMGIAAVMCVAVAALAVNAAWSAHEQRRSSASAINALDAVVTRVLSPMAPRMGTLQERRLLLDEIESDVQRVFSRSANDPRVARIFASTRVAKADIERELGLWDRAEALYADGVRAYEHLRSLVPDDLDAGHQHSLAIVKLGDSLAGRGDVSGARAKYNESRAIDEALVARDPDQIPLLSNLFWSYRRLAGLPETGRDQAAELTRLSILVAADMMRRDPDQWRSQQADVFARVSLVQASMDTSDPEEHLEHALAAVAAAERLVALDPTVTTHQVTLLQTISLARSAARAADKLELARELVARAEVIGKEIEPHADFRTLTYHLAPLEDARAQLAIDRSDWESAAKHLSNRIQLVELRRRNEALDPETYVALSAGLFRRSAVLLRLGRTAESEADRRECEAVVRQMTARFPNDEGIAQVALLIRMGLEGGPEGIDEIAIRKSLAR